MLLVVRVVLDVADLLRVVELEQALLQQRSVVVIQIQLLDEADAVQLVGVEMAITEAASEGLVVAHCQDRLQAVKGKGLTLICWNW